MSDSTKGIQQILPSKGASSCLLAPFSRCLYKQKMCDGVVDLYEVRLLLCSVCTKRPELVKKHLLNHGFSFIENTNTHLQLYCIHVLYDVPSHVHHAVSF